MEMCCDEHKVKTTMNYPDSFAKVKPGYISEHITYHMAVNCKCTLYMY